MNDTHSRTYIMKIASGAMNGQEIIINVDANLILIGKGNTYEANISDEGFTAHTFPSEQPPFEFSIVSTQEAGYELAIDLHTEKGSSLIPIKLQQLVLTDLFPFAIKPIDAPWELISDIQPLPEMTITTEKKSIKKKASTSKLKMATGISLIALTFVGFSLFHSFSEVSVNKKIQNITNILHGNQYPLVITEGKQNETLVLVKTQRDLDWSMQQLLKSQYKNKFSVIKIDELKNKIEAKLFESMPNALTIEINDPCNPTVKTISNTITRDEKKFIDKTFSSYFSCYSHSEIKNINIDDLLKKAELGLTESHVQWHKINQGNQIVYIIKDSLNDKQTISLIDFSNDFYQQWGNKLIQFSLSLANNPLDGKSFITNTDGYTLLGNNHWSFNSTKLN